MRLRARELRQRAEAATKLRPIGSALYFLVTLQAPVTLHRIRNDQLYHYYRGDPLELLLLRLDGSSEKAIIGPDVELGDAEALAKKYPHVAEEIRSFPRPG
ncbi:MAG TPA: cupin domain-containing protein [Reyranella sp.]|nr:cupin domain-containing protein [Reyranella sp.]